VKQALESDYDSIRQRAFPKYATLGQGNMDNIAYEVNALKDPATRGLMKTIMNRLSERVRGYSANKCSILF
jgi:hypothetical protein